MLCRQGSDKHPFFSYLCGKETRLYLNALLNPMAHSMTITPLRISLLLILLLGMGGCSTRDSSEHFRGSTSQRLLTYSINDLMARLPAKEFKPFANRPVYVRSHFVEASPILNYAVQRLKVELTSRLALQLVSTPEQADYELDFFFTSLGTDQDTYGLTIPIFWVSTDGELPTLDILAVRMYHGVSELYFYSKNRATGQVHTHQNTLARARADRFSTPFFSFAIDDLDEHSILDEIKE